ncbi:small subunit ribosomal protein S2 [Thermotomaculum hydrothermale]|uniref:Small ribosomal subunit protein uS2 n=1 Tax=Thermotomaculum hydrothermale TaxID=981385 RepID=A0A7R6SZH4_9BACT|nr:30S ribosomal protein S2 [Thermotomaculum hydrothermale]BBB32850.1 small subunit ribosomal protein S2 [Thermotomaculum hydrothermale]
MVDISMKELLEAGVHFGHQTRRWNPKMKKYIFGERNGIHIIDLQKTLKLFKEAAAFVTDQAAKGKTILFVGTKRQAQDAMASLADKGIPYVNQRWLGGTLTNFHTIKKSIEKYKALVELFESGEAENLPKKERYKLERKKNKMAKLFGGIKDLNDLPDVLFIIDPKREKNAVAEARKLNIPVVAIVDTNCDPDVIDYVIPGNDDAIRAINLFVNKMTQAIEEGKTLAQSEGDIEEEIQEPEDKEEGKEEEK